MKKSQFVRGLHLIIQTVGYLCNCPLWIHSDDHGAVVIKKLAPDEYPLVTLFHMLYLAFFFVFYRIDDVKCQLKLCRRIFILKEKIFF